MFGKITKMIKKTIEEFKEDVKRVWGDKYIVAPDAVYNGMHNKIKIICKKHGEFEIEARCFLRGQMCPQCRKEELSKQRLPISDFIKRANELYGKNAYDYSEVSYRNQRGKITIKCPKHGKFVKSVGSFLRGHGCPYCSKEAISLRMITPTEEYIKKANKIHHNKYSYTKTDLYNRDKNGRIIITCPIHGDFKQEVSSHLQGHGCYKCAIDESRKRNTFDKDRVLTAMNFKHNDKYKYDLSNYVNSKSIIGISCPIHGVFKQEVTSHLSGCGCPKCAHIKSNAENEIIEYVKGLVDKTEKILTNSRKIISPFELDIYVPSKKIAIEYNGLRWHSELFKTDKEYHLKKLEYCNSKDINLIQIFEDEWLIKKKIVKNKLKYLLKKDENLTKIMARKTVVNEIDKITAKKFLNENHIQGFAPSTVYLGCFYNEELVGVMTFLKEKNDGKWVLNRFSTDNKYICNGVGGKLFKYFIRKYQPTEVKSFADRRWTLSKENNLYTKLGFTLEKVLKPDYRYYFPNEFPKQRVHKFNFRKNILHNKYGFPLTMTESQMTEKLGAYKIWDCGLFKYVWKDNSE